MADKDEVEIKISGSVESSLGAAAEEVKAKLEGVATSATVSAAAMSKALEQAGGDLSKITPAMLGLSAATQATSAAALGHAAATGVEAAATGADTAATEVNTAAHVNSRAATEALVLVHEALSGRFTKMTGSAMILTQALAGTENTSAALSAIMSPLGLAIAATVAVVGAATVATIQYDAAQRALMASTFGVGAASGLSVTQLEAAGEAASKWSHQSIAASTEAAAAFAAAGVRSQEAVTSLAGDVEIFAQLTGEKAADAQKTLAEAMRDPVKGAEDLNQSLNILDSTAMEHIRTLSEMGDKDGAVAALVQALQQRMDDAKASGVGLASEFSQMTARLSDLWTWLGKVNEQLLIFQQFGPAGGGMMDMAKGQAEKQANLTHMFAELNQASTTGGSLFGATSEGSDKARRNELLGDAGKLAAAIVADTALRGANSQAVKDDKQALEEYTRAYKTFLPEAEKAHNISVLQDKLAVAKRAHNKGLIDDLSKQIELTKLAGQVMSVEEANTRATDAGRLGGDRASPGPKGKKGPSIVSEWQEQLHAAEIMSNDFFGDQTQRELDFWESKVGLTKKGSKEWLDVESKIYQAQKTLARQGYEEHLADLNDQIEADHNNWQKVQKDWDEKLAYIKSKFGEQSAEYQNAHREFLRAERQHQDQMFQAERDGEKKQLDQLKSHLSAMRAIRQTDAGASEAAIRDKELGNPLGEAEAAREIAQLHQQLNLQEIADLETTYNTENALLAAQVDRAKLAYTEDSKQYKDAVSSKLKADQDYADAKARLESQTNAQSIQDILAVKQAYHTYIDGVVGSTVSGLVGVAAYTQTWKQAVLGVYNSLLGSINQILTKMVTNWIVKHVLMTAAQRAQLAVQAAHHVASEGVKTAATIGGNAVRTTASIISAATTTTVKTVETGHHVGAEAVKTGATIVGDQARVASTAVASAQSAAIVGAHNLKEITSHAAAAAAAAYHAMAGIPVVGPALGAIAAAVTFTAVEAFGALASFDQGTNYVPNDMVAQIHAGERIIPAADNKALMSAINDNGVGPSRSAVGDTVNNHNWTYHDHSGRATPEDIYARRGALAKAWKQAYREGHFAGFRM